MDETGQERYQPVPSSDVPWLCNQKWRYRQLQSGAALMAHPFSAVLHESDLLTSLCNPWSFLQYHNTLALYTMQVAPQPYPVNEVMILLRPEQPLLLRF